MNMKYIGQRNRFAAGAAICIVLLAGCSKDDPKKEDTPELVTKATLVFTSVGGGVPVTASATDPDGDGVQNIAVDGPINLLANATYVMTIELINGLVAPGQPGYDISSEVEAEGIEHQFFFSWESAPFANPLPMDLFSNPAGDGNIDKGTDPVNYSGGSNSVDATGLNLGLTTIWTTGANISTGKFRVILKHQPGSKTSTSDVTVGETDLDITFTLNVQ